jgi:hypothetical protein
LLRAEAELRELPPRADVSSRRRLRFRSTCAPTSGNSEPFVRSGTQASARPQSSGFPIRGATAEKILDNR